MKCIFALLALSVLLAPAANACTVCDSPGGHALRSAVWNGHFLQTLLLVLAPAPVLVAAMALLHVALPDLKQAQPEAGTLSLLDPELAV